MAQPVPAASAMPGSNLAVAREARLKQITEVASDLGLLPDELEPYGRYKAKVHLEILKRLAGQPQSKRAADGGGKAHGDAGGEQ